MKKANIDLVTKPMFTVFLVIFVAIMSYFAFYSRAQVLQEQSDAGLYTQTINTLQFLISEPSCFADGDTSLSSWQQPIEGLLSKETISRTDTGPILIPCLPLTQNVYSLNIINLKTEEEYNFGFPQKTKLADRTITYSAPIAIVNGTMREPGRAHLTLYQGGTAEIIAGIGKVCHTQETITIEQSIKFDTSYMPNAYCYGGDCFTAIFSCEVEPFKILSGSRIITIKNNNGIVSIKT